MVYTKTGCTIGLVFGLIFMIFPIIGRISGEGAAQDNFIFIFIFAGLLMVIGNIYQLTKLSKNPAPVVQESKAKVQTVSQSSAKSTVKCRFCGKSYDSEYNGCPHCKKK